MRKNKIWQSVRFGFLSFLLFSVPAFVSAQGFSYTPLEKIPFLDNTTGDLGLYFEGIYRLGLILIVISAVLMLVIGGFMYLTSAGNTSRLGTAKDVIRDAIIGLILAIIAYLILNVINPDLTKLQITGMAPVVGAPIEGQVVQVTGGRARTIVVDPNQYTHAEALAILNASGIRLSSSGNCSDQKNKSCTSLDGIPKSTIAKLVAFKQGCGCSPIITGGTEVGHATHGIGRPIVDIRRESISSYITKQPRCGTSSGRAIYRDPITGGDFWDENSEHFHVNF